MNDPAEAPRLAPPGAGIPALERLVGGVILTLRRWNYSREQALADFKHQQEEIAGLYRPLDRNTLHARVLIPRLRGLEDSSRFWSVLMTLDHLRIVNHQIARVIESLTRGIVPEEPASTAAVKPSPEAGPEVAPAYEHSCGQLQAVVESGATLRTNARYAHPWFGRLDAAGWHAMAVTHMGIHRNQILHILRNHARRQT